MSLRGSSDDSADGNRRRSVAHRWAAGSARAADKLAEKDASAVSETSGPRRRKMEARERAGEQNGDLKKMTHLARGKKSGEASRRPPLSLLWSASYCRAPPRLRVDGARESFCPPFQHVGFSTISAGLGSGNCCRRRRRRPMLQPAAHSSSSRARFLLLHEDGVREDCCCSLQAVRDSIHEFQERAR